ncbi:V-set and immunoglobulin domain-containing protein 10 [Dendropsophus ebraccatus]|uniref:V-set and immunoglobulin domain-containing protein 10 n=1 Tax=Dendropsophus ebraccatus TaxID=150705 RepID=UPI0038317A9F
MGPREELLLLLLCALCSGGSRGAASVIIISGEEGGKAVLPCSPAAEKAQRVAWFMEDPKQEVLSCNKDSSPRYSRLNGSSLVISDLCLEDEGFYNCKDCSDKKDTLAQIQLKIARDSPNVTFQISPTRVLPNGSHYTSSGSSINFSCSSVSIPEPQISIVLSSGDKDELFVSENGSRAAFSLSNVQANYQGNYTCSVVNLLRNKTHIYTLQLLVYHPPAFSMRCSVENTGAPSGLSLTCSWLGAYPYPLLQWQNNGNVLSNSSSDTSVVTLNGSRYEDGQKFTCKGKHQIENEIKEETCGVQLGYPMPQAVALRTCLKGENVTLSCSVSGANPPAVVTWLRNLSDPSVPIQPGPKYQIVQQSAISYLTIVNCSKEEDEGHYICMAQNGVTTKDLYIWLDVTKPHNIVGLVSAILILFLIVVAIIVGTVLYCDPQLYIKANPFRKGASEVLILIESEEEEELQEVADPVASTEYTDAETISPATANGNVCKHEVLFHNPPDSLIPDLLSEISEETEGEPVEDDL